MFLYSGRMLSMIVMLSWGSSYAHAEVYKWVDEQGRIYYSDSRPASEKRPLIVDVSSPQVVSMTAQNSSATTGAKVSSSQVATEASSPSVASDNQSSNNADDSRTRRDRVVPPDPIRDPQCKAEWDRYDASKRCFEPFRLANGGVKPEAYKICKEVKQPTCH